MEASRASSSSINNNGSIGSAQQPVSALLSNYNIQAGALPSLLEARLGAHNRNNAIGGGGGGVGVGAAAASLDRDNNSNAFPVEENKCYKVSVSFDR